MNKPPKCLFLIINSVFFVSILIIASCDYNDQTPDNEVFLAQIGHYIFTNDHSFFSSFPHIISKNRSPSTLLVLDRSPP